jgi:hypothetical protein
VSDEAVHDLARRAGIAVDWTNAAGEPQRVAPDVLRRMLEALKLPCDTPGELAAIRYGRPYNAPKCVALSRSATSPKIKEPRPGERPRLFVRKPVGTPLGYG